jgi:cadmium resistance protein CadD (predicted permease)
VTGLPEAVISAGSAIWLGLLTSISPCPLATNVAAALFFASLVPLAVLIAFGARFVAKAFNSLAVVERWARRLTGLVFVGVGIYMTLVYTLGVQL